MRINSKAQIIVGHSEGGLAAQYVAQRVPVFAGVASVKGTSIATDPTPPRNGRTAALIILGQNDDVLQISGGDGYYAGPFHGLMVGAFPYVQDSHPLRQTQVWSRANECKGARVVTGRSAQVTDYLCKGAPVRQIITNTGHHWDGESTSEIVVDTLLKHHKLRR